MLSEQLLDEIEAGQGETLTRLARLIRPSRGDRPTSFGCLWRWATSGVQGPNGERVYLEVARLGGKLISSPGAIRRFVLAQTPGAPQAAAPQRTVTARRRAAEKANEELEALGA